MKAISNHEEIYKGFIIEIRLLDNDNFVLIIDGIHYIMNSHNTFGGKKYSEYKSLQDVIIAAKNYVDKNLSE